MNSTEKHAKSPRSRGKTSTREILGGFAQPGRIQRRWAEYHRRLSDLRDQFSGTRREQNSSARQEQSTSGEHMADAATDSFDRDCALALLSSAQNALYEIEQALNRIKDGTFGLCELTGQAIETERLKAIPWTRYSAAAQAQLEARGVASRVQLGELGSCLHSGVDSADEEFELEAEREAA